MNEIEDQFREQPLRPLPGDWKGEILDAADSAPPAPKPVDRTAQHSSTLAWFLSIVPKPLTLPLAAAWMIIVALRVLTPASHASSLNGLVAGSLRELSQDERHEALKVRTMNWIAMRANELPTRTQTN
jgi:hypothetical protein